MLKKICAYWIGCFLAVCIFSEAAFAGLHPSLGVVGGLIFVFILYILPGLVPIAWFWVHSNIVPSTRKGHAAVTFLDILAILLICIVFSILRPPTLRGYIPLWYYFEIHNGIRLVAWKIWLLIFLISYALYRANLYTARISDLFYKLAVTSIVCLVTAAALAIAPQPEVSGPIGRWFVKKEKTEESRKPEPPSPARTEGSARSKMQGVFNISKQIDGLQKSLSVCRVAAFSILKNRDNQETVILNGRILKENMEEVRTRHMRIEAYLKEQENLDGNPESPINLQVEAREEYRKKMNRFFACAEPFSDWKQPTPEDYYKLDKLIKLINEMMPKGNKSFISPIP